MSQTVLDKIILDKIIEYTNLDFIDVPEVIKVVGVTIDNKQEIIAKMVDGEEVDLKRDYDNQYDPNAIAVIYAKTQQQVGWVPRDVAQVLAQYFDAGFRYHGVVDAILGGGDFNYGVRIKLSPLF